MSEICRVSLFLCIFMKMFQMASWKNKMHPQSISWTRDGPIGVCVCVSSCCHGNSPLSNMPFSPFGFYRQEVSNFFFPTKERKRIQIDPLNYWRACDVTVHGAETRFGSIVCLENRTKYARFIYVLWFLLIGIIWLTLTFPTTSHNHFIFQPFGVRSW